MSALNHTLSYLLTTLMLTVACLSGCDSDTTTEATPTPTETEEDELAVEACGHLAQGPFEDVTATAEADGAPSASFPHTTVNITLVDAGE